MRILIFGPPGAGKGTYASRLSRKLYLPHISMGDLVREESRNETNTGKVVNEYTKHGQLVPDDIIVRILQERISKSDCVKGFVLDGYPRTIPQAEALEKNHISRYCSESGCPRHHHNREAISPIDL